MKALPLPLPGSRCELGIPAKISNAKPEEAEPSPKVYHLQCVGILVVRHFRFIEAYLT
jgi:hypothetical protein